MPLEAPPAYAWDWIARHRLAWREVRRRLVAAGYDVTGIPSRGDASASGRAVGDVPDWSVGPSVPVAPAANTDVPRDYRPLDTRAEVIAALRLDYPHDPTLRRTVDEAIAQVAFLGRLDVPLSERGVRSAPRGMRWWWSHLSGHPVMDGPYDAHTARGPSTDTAGTEHRAQVPLQLRLVDVLAGYGDAPDA